ncbi:hypothetical protein GCM10028808_45770 [Spirosoma migulaei]
MKIVFICGSLENGKDGVGDYTRALAGELIRLGHSISIIALHDKFILNGELETVQYSSTYAIKTLRISKKIIWKDKIDKASAFISQFKPDWISLQYVPFAYDDKGLPFGLANQLNKLNDGYKWHIMFHELWLGMDVEASLKYILWGKIQRYLIQSLILKLKPKIIHSHTELYILHLLNFGVNVSRLPLFSSIPNISTNNSIYQDSSTKNISFAIFGNIHPGALSNSFIEELYNYQQENNISVLIRFIGRNGDEKKRLKSVCSTLNIQIEDLGEQSLESISEYFMRSSFGIATTPYYLVEKSSSAAAMIEHHLPVICVSYPWHPKGFTSIKIPSFFIEYKPGNLKNIILGDFSTTPQTSLKNVAMQFTNDLFSTV